MSSPHKISEEFDHGRNCETWYETSGRKKRKRTPSMRECQEKLPSFLFTTNIIPPDRAQIFDTFLFSGGAFRSSAGCLRPNIFSLLSTVFLLASFFQNFSDDFRGRGLGKGPLLVVIQHVLCTKLQSAGARVVSKRYPDALKRGKERAPELCARHSCSGNSIECPKRKKRVGRLRRKSNSGVD